MLPHGWCRRLWRAWCQRSWAERGLLLEAVVWLGLARAGIVCLPFRWLIRRAGLQPHQVLSLVPSSAPAAAVPHVRRAVHAVSRYTPWESNCLAQAFAAHRMLRGRHIATQLYLGVAKHGDQAFEAHAWLRCGEIFVTGEADVQRFTVVAMFMSLPAPSEATRQA